MALSFVMAVEGGVSGDGADVLMSVGGSSGALNIQAGDTLVLVAEWEGGTTLPAVTCQKDSGSPSNAFSFNAADRLLMPGSGDWGVIAGYLESAAADATAKFNVHFDRTVTWPSAHILQFRGGLVRQASGASSFQQLSGTTANSGNITTTVANSVAVGCNGNNSNATTSAEQIGGSAGTEPASSPAASGNSQVWYRILSGIMTDGAATATIGSSDNITGVIAFSEAAGAPASTYTLGAGSGYFGI